MTAIRPNHTNEHSSYCTERNVAGMRRMVRRADCATCRAFDAGRASVAADLDQLETLITPDGLVFVLLDAAIATASGDAR